MKCCQAASARRAHSSTHWATSGFSTRLAGYRAVPGRAGPLLQRLHASAGEAVSRRAAAEAWRRQGGAHRDERRHAGCRRVSRPPAQCRRAGDGGRHHRHAPRAGLAAAAAFCLAMRSSFIRDGAACGPTLRTIPCSLSTTRWGLAWRWMRNSTWRLARWSWLRSTIRSPIRCPRLRRHAARSALQRASQQPDAAGHPSDSEPCARRDGARPRQPVLCDRPAVAHPRRSRIASAPDCDWCPAPLTLVLLPPRGPSTAPMKCFRDSHLGY